MHDRQFQQRQADSEDISMSLSTDAGLSSDTRAEGGFGRTERASIQVTDRGGDIFRAEVYRCVNVTTDPELREALVSGALYQVAAPAGDEPYQLALPMRYHDEELGIFALILPEELRHREFALRAELLGDLSRVSGDLPDYIRNFDTIYGARNIVDLEARNGSRGATQGRQVGGQNRLAADGGAAAAAEEATSIIEMPDPAGDADSGTRAEMDEAWRRIEQEREQLAGERRQLDEVRERIDRERARMDEVERELSAERVEIGELRSELQAMSLNLEQKQMQIEQGVPQSNAEESTQVVTDDQFVEVFHSDEDAFEDEAAFEEDVNSALYGEASEATELFASPYAEGESGGDLDAAEPAQTLVTRVDAVGVAKNFDADLPTLMTVIDGRVFASARVDAGALEAIKKSENLSFFVQGAFMSPNSSQINDDSRDYPFVGLLLAALDAEDHATASVGWALDPGNPDDEIVLSRLEGSVKLHAALYDEAGELSGVYEIQAPLHDNVAWIRARISQIVDGLGPDDPMRELLAGPGAFRAAADRWLAPDYERLGHLRHNFGADSFADATTPAELALAAGIVGYWSGSDRFEYLVANRSFPIGQFDAIQKRVVRRAVQQGIYIERPLREIAVAMGLAVDETELAQRLISEFAEVSVGLRKNDLDPLQEWENWDALVVLAEEVGATLDPDVLELAEASLKRAQDFQEAEMEAGARSESRSQEGDADGVDHSQVDLDSMTQVDSLLVARRSETTGVTYFLPDDAVLDTFDDLASMACEDLELLLEDPKGRLEAAQMLVERFEAQGTRLALQGAETMTAPEVAALARFVETKAHGLEAELVRCVEAGGPSATYIAARALAGISSAPAIPTLLDAYRDPRRRGDAANLARVLAQYGEKLMPGLKRSIKSDGHDAQTSILLAELERLNPGMLDGLARDRSKKVRSAASAARGK
jgi:hypothetical protein